MASDVYLSAPDGPMVAEVRLSDRWTWMLPIAAAGVVAVGAIFFAPGAKPAARENPVLISVRVASDNSEYLPVKDRRGCQIQRDSIC
jgi:hypothetical protein